MYSTPSVWAPGKVVSSASGRRCRFKVEVVKDLIHVPSFYASSTKNVDPKPGESFSAARLAKFLHFRRQVDLKRANLRLRAMELSGTPPGGGHYCQCVSFHGGHAVEPLSGRGCCRFRVTGSGAVCC